MRRHGNLFLAGKGSIGNPHRTRPDPGEKPRQGGLIHWRRRKIIFEIAGHLNFAHAKFRETPRVDRLFAQDKYRSAPRAIEQGPEICAKSERPRGQAGIDERERNFAAAGFNDEIWRHFRAGNQDDIRPPMIEKPRRKSRHVERRKLVQGWRQARRVEGPAAAFAGCQNHGKTKLPEFFDERRQGGRLRRRLPHGARASGPPGLSREGRPSRSRRREKSSRPSFPRQYR